MRILSIIFLFCFTTFTWAVERGTLQFGLRDSDVYVVDDEKGTSIVLSSDRLFLKPGDVTMNVEEYPYLDTVLYLVKRYPECKIEITAHTDNVPPQPYQYELSFRQAKQVADYLTAGGVNPNRIIKVSGEGDAYPMALNETAMGRSYNRRVEVTFLRYREAESLMGIPGGEIKEEILEALEHERERRENEAEIFKGK